MDQAATARPDTKHEAVLRELVAIQDGMFCNRCRCCEMFFQECWSCGGHGVDGHDCCEDSCCCLDPEENVGCHACGGEGGWWHCGCDENGRHPVKVVAAAGSEGR